MPNQLPTLTSLEIDRLANALHRGAAEASTALAQWLNAHMTMSIDSVDQCLLEDATSVLGNGDSTICVCVMEMRGTLTGHMLLAFDDSSGLAVSDLLLSQSPGTAVTWGEVETSCILETMNIAGSACLNGIAWDLSERSGQAIELIPTPPVFLRDFAESVLETAFLDQAAAGNNVIFALTRFHISGRPRRWTFLLIPDPSSFEILSRILGKIS